MPYTTPNNGLAAYSAPDPAQLPVATIPAGEPLEAVEWRGDWAHVRCTNGWTGWVDGRILRAQDAARAAESGQFVATHAIPNGGLAAWTEPDPAQPPSHNVAGGLPVRVRSQNGGWAQVEFSNGWCAWIDGSRLVAASAATGGAASAGTSGAAFTRPATASIVAAVGAAIVVVSTFLPWFTFGPLHIDAWDTPIKYLLTGKGGDGLKVGLVLLIPAVAALPVLTRWLMPRWATVVLGVLPLTAAVFALVRTMQGTEPRPGLGIGVIAAAIGGAVVVASSWVGSRRA